MKVSLFYQNILQVSFTFAFFQSTYAYTLADDCADYEPVVIAALEEALNIADYGSKRASDTTYPRLGTLLQDMLGASSEDDETALELASTWLTNAANTRNTLLIHCSDKHLKLVNPATRSFRDPDLGGAFVKAPGTNKGQKNACGGAVEALTYYYTENGGGQVIILCSDSAIGALRSYETATFDSFRTMGNLKEILSKVGLGLDIWGLVLSYKIMHELMHAASDTQFPGTLPSGQTEIYKYNLITGRAPGEPATAARNVPAVNDLQHNADSFALLACGWYLPPYAWVNGECRIVPKLKRPPTAL